MQVIPPKGENPVTIWKVIVLGPKGQFWLKVAKSREKQSKTQILGKKALM